MKKARLGRNKHIYDTEAQQVIEEQTVQEPEHVDPIIDLTADDSQIHMNDAALDPPAPAKTKG